MTVTRPRRREASPAFVGLSGLAFAALAAISPLLV